MGSRRSDSNRQPAVYKTAALPLSYVGRLGDDRGKRTVPYSKSNACQTLLHGPTPALGDVRDATTRILAARLPVHPAGCGSLLPVSGRQGHIIS